MLSPKAQGAYSTTPIYDWQDPWHDNEPGWVWLPLKGKRPATVADDPVAWNGRDFGGPHETTHELNSKLRLTMPDTNFCYVMNGRGCFIREPKLRLSAFAATVPQKDRGGGYQLYLVQQCRYWDGQPLYVLDELSAYANGFQVYQATGNQNATISLERYKEFLRYADLLGDYIEKHQPDYDLSQYCAIVAYQRNRLARLLGETPSTAVQTKIIVWIAPDAPLWLNGKSTSKRGAVREFVASPAAIAIGTHKLESGNKEAVVMLQTGKYVIVDFR